MPNDVSIGGITPNPPAGGTEPLGGAAPGAAPATTRAPAPPGANPTLRFDPVLGLVVIEFHNAAGAVTSSVPSQRQIDAYRRWQETGGAAPNLPGVMPSDGSATRAAIKR